MRAFLLAFTATLALTLSGCGKDPEEGMVDAMEELADVLKNVKTKADAEKAKSEVRNLVQAYVDHAKEFAEQLNDEGAMKSLQKFAEAHAKAQDAMMEISKKMRDPEIGAVLGEELNKIK